MKRDHWEKNYYDHFLAALKAFKTKRELHHCLTTLKVFNSEKDAITVLKFLIPKKDFITCLGLFNIQKELYHFLETLKGFNFEQ